MNFKRTGIGSATKSGLSSGKRTLASHRNSTLVEQEEKRQDLGFGTRINSSYARLINKDGSFNVSRVHASFWHRLNLYHRLITMSWPKFLLLVFAAYMTVNAIFSILYLLAGPEYLKGLPESNTGNRFWGAFFFSAQTLTTVGYGHVSPSGYLTSAIAAFESMIGLLAFALATGLLYGRFSRPIAHVRFSRNAVFGPYLDVNAWMFRIINQRSNQLIDVEVEVSLSQLETKPDGTPFRRYYLLKLERSKVNFFPANWTLVHPITESSPLYGCTPEQLEESDAEFLILLRAVDDTFSQMVHARTSYRADEVLWGRKFRSMVDSKTSGNYSLDMDTFDDTSEVPLNS
ncbi:ion channel [Nibrella saemangeumensis]|uniref:Ion channel n=1 Tax=Nibrella saemangeumensis TaxID=1084526 RepID=A0ABP8MJE0_9BACT